MFVFFNGCPRGRLAQARRGLGRGGAIACFAAAMHAASALMLPAGIVAALADSSATAQLEVVPRGGKRGPWKPNITGPLRRWFTDTRPIATGPAIHSMGPPACRTLDTCAPSSTCDASAASPFHAAAPPPAALPRLSARAGASLRIFFLDGHVGPMNDMLSTLHDMLGTNESGVEGMVFMQGMLNRNQIDKRFFKCRLCRLGYNVSRNLAGWLIHAKGNRSARIFTLPNCEAKRCRSGMYDDAIRRDFARMFGAHLEAKYDAVACNFPTWQCALFTYVRVAILLRFTHRYDRAPLPLPQPQPVPIDMTVRRCLCRSPTPCPAHTSPLARCLAVARWI